LNRLNGPIRKFQRSPEAGAAAELRDSFAECIRNGLGEGVQSQLERFALLNGAPLEVGGADDKRAGAVPQATRPRYGARTEKLPVELIAQDAAKRIADENREVDPLPREKCGPAGPKGKGHAGHSG